MNSILFRTDMIKAILACHKTQTRCVMKPQPSISWMNWAMSEYGGEWTGDPNSETLCILTKDNKEVRCPYGKVGDLLWVREKHAIECPYGPAKGCDNPDHIIYWANEEQIIRESITAKWRPSIFMPKWASRITLQIKSIKVERIQDITSEDCLKEGITPKSVANFFDLKGMFRELWDNNGWETNLWVWIVGFEMIKHYDRTNLEGLAK